MALSKSRPHSERRAAEQWCRKLTHRPHIPGTDPGKWTTANQEYGKNPKEERAEKKHPLIQYMNSHDFWTHS